MTELGGDVQLELCWGVSPQAPLIELGEAAGAAGFASITVTPKQCREAFAAGFTPRTILERLRASGVIIGVLDPVGASMPGAKPAAETPAYYHDFLRTSEAECLEIAEALEIRRVNVSNNHCRPVEFAALAEALDAIAERASRRGVYPVIEFQPTKTNNVPDLQAARRLVEAVGVDRLGIMFDAWHFARCGGHSDELEALPEGWIGGLQISDRIPPPRGEAYVPMTGRLLPGEGRLPLKRWLEIVTRRNPGVPLGCEVFSATLAALPPRTAAQRTADAFRRLIAL